MTKLSIDVGSDLLETIRGFGYEPIGFEVPDNLVIDKQTGWYCHHRKGMVNWAENMSHPRLICRRIKAVEYVQPTVNDLLVRCPLACQTKPSSWSDNWISDTLLEIRVVKGANVGRRRRGPTVNTGKLVAITNRFPAGVSLEQVRIEK